MFASQLLRILETLPTDADHGGCVFDTPEDKATVKDNQNGILSHSNSYNEAKSLLYPTKDFLDSNGYGSCKETLASDTKDRGELWKVSDLYESVHFDDISKSNNDEMLNEALPNIITSRRYRNPFACDTKDIDQQWDAPELECSMISDCIDEKEKGFIVSDAPFTSVCKFFETDKCAKEYELPELIVCYKESNYNIVKDICNMDDSVPVADEDQQSNTSESADTELCSTGESKSSVEYENNEEKDTEDEVNNDDDTDTYLEDLIMIFGSKGTTKWKYTNQSETYSSANVMMLHTKESGVEKNPQQSNPDSDQSEKQPDQIPFEETTPESQNAVSGAVNEANNSMPATDLFYNSELGTEAIVFDFNSTKPTTTSSNMDQGVENIPEPSLGLQATNSHKDGISQMHFSNIVDRRSNNVHGQSLESQDVADLDIQGQFADGEASFSALGSASGLVVYSRRASSSESISLGSDNSTTSTGSFAFPILQSEWNDSPVRMGEVGSRHFRKHKGWKQGILCCRF